MPEQPLTSLSERESGPIRSVKDFVKRYFPNAEECPQCSGTGIKRGSDTTIAHLRESAADVKAWPPEDQRSQAIRGASPPRHTTKENLS